MGSSLSRMGTIDRGTCSYTSVLSPQLVQIVQIVQSSIRPFIHTCTTQYMKMGKKSSVASCFPPRASCTAWIAFVALNRASIFASGELLNGSNIWNGPEMTSLQSPCSLRGTLHGGSPWGVSRQRSMRRRRCMSWVSTDAAKRRATAPSLAPPPPPSSPPPPDPSPPPLCR